MLEDSLECDCVLGHNGDKTHYSDLALVRGIDELDVGRLDGLRAVGLFAVFRRGFAASIFPRRFRAVLIMPRTPPPTVLAIISNTLHEACYEMVA